VPYLLDNEHDREGGLFLTVDTPYPTYFAGVADERYRAKPVIEKAKKIGQDLVSPKPEQNRGKICGTIGLPSGFLLLIGSRELLDPIVYCWAGANLSGVDMDDRESDTTQRRIFVNSMDELMRTSVRAPLKKRSVTNASVLNEAYAYAKPSSFSRGMRIDLNGVVILLVSGTASIDENGRSVHIGDFRAQLRRTFSNITGLLESEGCTWHDIVRTTCYLRDIDRDYEVFNEERTAFYNEQGLDPLPASTGIEAKLCRPELLVEIEAIAMFLTEKTNEANLA
jgi:2-iminobutanoate/2-iminopropanoate deaminase